ncbi:hypothetical protein L6R29_05110 [Myxococcota bacterium]|nr:hypothetical protein [Myxococcota bacterium]
MKRLGAVCCAFALPSESSHLVGGKYSAVGLRLLCPSLTPTTVQTQPLRLIACLGHRPSIPSTAGL